jgi:hypothetical protein
MKITVLISLIIVVGCILTTGCVGQVKNEIVDNTTVTPVNTFTTFSDIGNTSNISTVSNITVGTGLKGPLRISIGGWTADLPVTIDNKSVGVVTHDKPLTLMVDEGNHTVQVCAGKICESQNVTIKFANQRTIDFEEQLIRDVGFPTPTARIVGYYPIGDQIFVDVEYINPSIKDVVISAHIATGYSYIESRTNNRVGGVTEGLVSASVKSGTRVTDTEVFDLASGYSYTYSVPEISKISVR